jgi:hypothetical protein
MEVLGGEPPGCDAEQQESDERSVHAGTYAGTWDTATNELPFASRSSSLCGCALTM